MYIKALIATNFKSQVKRPLSECCHYSEAHDKGNIWGKSLRLLATGRYWEVVIIVVMSYNNTVFSTSFDMRNCGKAAWFIEFSDTRRIDVMRRSEGRNEGYEISCYALYYVLFT